MDIVSKMSGDEFYIKKLSTKAANAAVVSLSPLERKTCLIAFLVTPCQGARWQQAYARRVIPPRFFSSLSLASAFGYPLCVTTVSPLPCDGHAQEVAKAGTGKREELVEYLKTADGEILVARVAKLLVHARREQVQPSMIGSYGNTD